MCEKNVPTDVQLLIQRSPTAKKVLSPFKELDLAAFSEKPFNECFANKRRYPEGFSEDRELNPWITPFGVLSGCFNPWPEIVPAQAPAKIRVYKMKGMSNYVKMAAELLGVSDETPASWLRQLLIQRGYTFSLSSIEGLIETQTRGEDVGLAGFSNHVCHHP